MNRHNNPSHAPEAGNSISQPFETGGDTVPTNSTYHTTTPEGSYTPPAPVSSSSVEEGTARVTTSNPPRASKPEEETDLRIAEISQEPTIPNNYSFEDNNNNSNNTGGRLWKLAGQQVQQEQEKRHAPQTQSRTNAWTETIRERTRSRATPHAAPLETASQKTTSSSAPHLLEDTATNPNRSLSLLCTGLVGVLAGWMGNAVVGTSCHFATVLVAVGGQQTPFPLHFGLYKYSTVDSSLNGYKYCYPYSGDHEDEAPVAARVLNLLALISGTICMGVVWWYLIVGYSRAVSWTWSVRAAYAAALFQVTTLCFYAEPLCQQHTCSPGPASYLTLVSAAVWIGVGWELHRHRPQLQSESKKVPQFLELPTPTIDPTTTTTTTKKNTTPYEPPELS